MESFRTPAFLIVILFCFAGCSEQRGSSSPNDLPPNDAVGALVAQISIGDADDILNAAENCQTQSKITLIANRLVTLFVKLNLC